MDGSTFDQFTRRLAGRLTRRTGLAGALSALMTGVPAVDIAAKRREPGRDDRAADDAEVIDEKRPCGPKASDNKCRKNKDCCTRYCRRRKGKTKSRTGRCRCIRLGRKCKKRQKCCGKATCQNRKCKVAPTCQATGATCTSDANCCSGLSCLQGVCSSCGATGATCTTDANCCSGLVCDQGVCSSCGVTGATCTTDANCCSGLYCLQGVCGPCEATVCASGCPFTTVNAAYAAATAGDTIYIGAGTYPTGIIVTRDITLAACPGVTAILEPDRLVKDSTANYYPIMTEDTVDTTTKHAVTLRNLTLQGTATGVSNRDEVLLASYQNGLISWTVDTCNLSKAYVAVYPSRGNHVIVDSVFSDFTFAGVCQNWVQTSPDAMSMTVTGSSFNACDSYGLAFYPVDGATVDAQMTVTDCTFTNNKSISIYFDGAPEPTRRATRKAFITNSTFNANPCAFPVIDFKGVTMEVSGCTITNNADSAIRGTDSDLTIKDTLIEGNVAQGVIRGDGGGVSLVADYFNSSLTVSGSTEIKNNSAKVGSYGGGIYVANVSSTTVTVSGTSTTNVTGNTPDQCYKFIQANPGASGVKDCGTWT